MLIATMLSYGITELAVFVCVPACIASLCAVRHASGNAFHIRTAFVSALSCSVIAFPIVFLLAAVFRVASTMVDCIALSLFCSLPFVPVGYLPSLFAYTLCYYLYTWISRKKNESVLGDSDSGGDC